jgi:hypothetical protein
VQKLKTNSQYCPLCGKENDLENVFCQYCGNPLAVNKNSPQSGDINSPKKETKLIELGYASSLCSALNNDSFNVMEITSIFGGTKHRIILCSIVKGLVKIIDNADIVDSLLSEILSQQQPDYKEHLNKIQKKFQEKTSVQEVKAEGNAENGLLVSVIDNNQMTSLNIDAPCIYVINKDLKQTIMLEEKSTIQTRNLENNDIICLACSDIAALEGKKDFLKAILNANSLQSACSTVVLNLQKKKAGSSFSIVLVKTK